MNSDGFKADKVDLHDAGIWVTRVQAPRGPKGLYSLGRLNTELKTVDISMETPQSPDVLQSGSTVVLHAQNQLTVVDPRLSVTKPDSRASIAPQSTVGLGGETLAVLASGSRRALRVVDASRMTKAAFEGKPTATLGRAAAMTVGVDGMVHAVDGNQLRTYDSSGSIVKTRKLPARLTQPAVTAVGATPVVLDVASKTLFVSGETVALGSFGNKPVLQQPSEDEKFVVVATDTSLVHVPLDGGDAEEVFDRGTGDAVAPVRLVGCTYGAWQANPTQASQCGEAPVVANNFGSGRRALVFRVNRQRVTLNDKDNGEALIFVNSKPQVVSGAWQDALTVEDEQKSQDPNAGETRVDRKDETSGQPLAPDISVNARVGRSRTIQAMAHAKHAYFIAEVTQPNEGVAGIGVNGQTVEFDPGDGAPGSRGFEYTVSNGAATAKGRITVNVLPADAAKNNAPTAVADQITMVPGSTAVINVLANDDDRDGDGVQLVDATAGDASLDPPQARPDGSVVVHAGQTPGNHTINYVIRDDYGAPGAGQITLNVNPQAKVDALDDFAVGFVGREVPVHAVANDLSPSGQLRMSAVTADDANIVVRERSDNEARFVATRPGFYTVTYQAVDDETGSDDTAKIRLAIKDPKTGRPTAGRDTASVAVNTPVLIPVLQNDSDPDGDVLAVGAIEPASRDLARRSGLQVELLNREFVRITASKPILPNAPVQLRYQLTDGSSPPVPGTIVVRGLDAAEDKPPVSTDDTLVLRPGLVGAVRVLDNDLDPEGGKLSLDRPIGAAGSAAAGTSNGQLDCTTGSGLPCPPGTAFVQDDLVRVVAPATPGRLDITYAAVDPAGNKDGAVLHVAVVARENQAPLPPVVEARTTLGRAIDIPIPVLGADPDGDVVSFAGVVGPPSRGQVVVPDAKGVITNEKGERVKLPANTIHFVPTEAGPDELSYTVRDPEGLEGKGVVRIAIIGPSSNPPVAVPDAMAIAPGKTVEVDVLGNDSDPDGDPITLESPSKAGFKMPAGVVDVRTDSGVIVFKAPMSAKPGTRIAVPYRIYDAAKQSADSVLTIEIVERPVGVAPIAVDDVLPPAAPGTMVRVNVVDNDSDPDGLASAGTVTSAGKRVKGGVLSFRMPQTSVQTKYTLRDVQGHEASAFVIVPLLDETSIRTRPDSADVEPGEQVTIDVLANDDPSDGLDLDSFPQLPSTGGTVKIEGSKVSFTADPAFEGGIVNFTYKAVLRSNKTKSQEGAVTVNVGGKKNQPPVFAGLEIRVPAGGEASIDLRPGVTDLNPTDTFTFSEPKSASPKVQVSRTGSTLKVSADKDAFSATSGVVPPITFTVTDSGKPALTAPGQVAVSLLPSDKPLPVLGNDEYQVLRKDGPKSFQVLDNDIGDGLKIKSFTQPGGSQGQVSQSGSSLTFTPPADGPNNFSGKTSFSYTVSDSSGETSHELTATVTVDVVGKPDAPTKPTASKDDVGNKQVTLHWSVPTANGDPIERYEVSGDSGFRGKTCSSNDCVIDGLTNGTTYRFTVKACSPLAGCGEASPPSDGLEPNKRPDPSTFTELTAGDKQLTLKWTDASSSEGTAITGYKVSISPAASPPQTPGAGVRMATFSGLTNGTEYIATVIAVNKAGESEPTRSSPIVPFGLPLWASGAKPTATAGDQQINVTWPTPNANGSPLKDYTLYRFKNGAADGTEKFGAGTNSTSVRNLTNGSPYTFEVTATNARGESLHSARSDVVTASGKPMQIGSVTAKEANTSATLTFTVPGNNGSAITSYQVTRNGGSSQTISNSTPTGGTATLNISGLTNGTAYTFGVAACNTNPTSTKCGASTNSNQVTPFGPPSAPAVSGGNQPQGDYTIEWSWNTPANNGKAILRYELIVDGSSAGTTTANTFARSFGPSQAHTLQVMAVNNDSPRSASSAGSNTSSTGPAPPPPRRVIVSVGEPYNPPDSGCTTCKRIIVTLENFGGGTRTAQLYCDVSCGSSSTGWGAGLSGRVAVNDGQNRTAYAYGYGNGCVWATVEDVRSDNNCNW